jgi:hypothetical protein
VSEYKLGKEEIVTARIVKELPEYCRGCLRRKIYDCDFAEEPAAIEKCVFVQRWFEREMMK